MLDLGWIRLSSAAFALLFLYSIILLNSNFCIPSVPLEYIKINSLDWGLTLCIRHKIYYFQQSTTMARRYDSSTTTFSPEGRLHQVEYAIEAINNAGTCVGILAKDGVVMATERRVTSGLLAPAKVRNLIISVVLTFPT
jgi:hypothetical protein